MDVPAGHVVHHGLGILGYRLGLPLDEEHPLVAQGARPVSVNLNNITFISASTIFSTLDLKLTSDVLGDNQLLGKI